MYPEVCLIFPNSTTGLRKYIISTCELCTVLSLFYLKYICIVQRTFVHVHYHILYNICVMSYPLGEEKQHSFP